MAKPKKPRTKRNSNGRRNSGSGRASSVETTAKFLSKSYDGETGKPGNEEIPSKTVMDSQVCTPSVVMDSKEIPCTPTPESSLKVLLEESQQINEDMVSSTVKKNRIEKDKAEATHIIPDKVTTETEKHETEMTGSDAVETASTTPKPENSIAGSTTRKFGRTEMVVEDTGPGQNISELLAPEEQEQTALSSRHDPITNVSTQSEPPNRPESMTIVKSKVDSSKLEESEKLHLDSLSPSFHVKIRTASDSSIIMEHGGAASECHFSIRPASVCSHTRAASSSLSSIPIDSYKLNASSERHNSTSNGSDVQPLAVLSPVTNAIEENLVEAALESLQSIEFHKPNSNVLIPLLHVDNQVHTETPQPSVSARGIYYPSELHNDIMSPWIANSTILCYGNLITGPHPCFLLLSLALMVRIRVLALSSVPSLPKVQGLLFGRIAVPVALFASIFCALRAAFTEPGVIPRRVPPGIQLTTMPDASVEVDGVRLKAKWCGTCGFHRPLRASHCRVCDACVDRFDHHCPWVSNCIGVRNHKWFYFFVIFTTLLAATTFATTFVVMKDDFLSIEASRSLGMLFPFLRVHPMRSVLLIYSLVFLIPLVVFSIFHTFLICFNKTAREWEKDVFVGRNPFDQGVWRNIKSLLLTSAPASRIPSVVSGMETSRSLREGLLVTWRTSDWIMRNRPVARNDPFP